MREAIGGTMLFWIVLFFVSIFIGFLAAVTQYGRVFRIKNAMVNYIEQTEGIATQADIDEFVTYLRSKGYSASREWILCKDDVTARGRQGNYYYLTLYAYFHIPLISPIELAIKGDTRIVDTGVNKEVVNNKDFENNTDVFHLDASSGRYCYSSSDSNR